jgi:catechol-2,3-dioxygenase
MQIQELGHVVLYVSNLERSADFYKNILGFHEIERRSGIALFGKGRTHHELLLIEVGGSPKQSRDFNPGLYHIGFKIGDTPESLQEAYRELVGKGVHIVGASDHTVTHSLYVLDPDNNELELYADVNDVWKKDPKAILSPIKSLRLM